jgi:MFS family permease
VFGPTLAGLLIVTMGFGWSFALDALSYLAVILCILLMRPAELYRVALASKAEGQIRESLRYVFATPVLWSNFLMLTLVGTFTLNFTVTLPLFVTGPLQSDTVVFTTLYSIFSAGAVVCSLVIAHRRLVRITHVISGAVALGIATIFLGLSPWVGVATLAAFFVGLSSTLFTVSTTTLVQVETREDMRGRILALQMALLVGTTPISGPLLGWMADMVGARAPLIVGGAASIIAAYIGYLAAHRTPGRTSQYSN